MKNDTEYSLLIGITRIIQMVDAINPMLAKISLLSNNFFNRYIYKYKKSNSTII